MIIFLVILLPHSASAYLGDFLKKWPSDYHIPNGVAVDSSGNVYVADTENNRIQVFDNSGTYLRQWGSEGSGNGEFVSPEGVAVNSSGKVYVADTDNHRIQIFDRSGAYLHQWGGLGER